MSTGRIPREFIDDLLTRVDIVDVIGRRIPLKKKGKDSWACCPFHGEKTPSFSVSQPKQFYKCFGCGVSGNAISFIMEFDRCDFVTAIESLADIAGVDVPREQGSDPQAGLRMELYQLLADVSLFFQQQLREESGSAAIAYLKKRGVSGEVAKKFSLGFAPPTWESVLKKFGGSDKQRDLLLQAGLLSKKDGGKYYDFFRDRVMFPVRDARGRTIAFGGRVMDQGDAGSASVGGDRMSAAGPKYLNSPETPVFQKGHELYGLFEAKQERHALNERVILVEGYMDVVALAQHGVFNAVAALGTAASKSHLETLFKICPEIVCCFDGDKAGRNAAWRALNHALALQREGRQVKFLFLPEGEDPDSLVRQEGNEKFNQRLKAQSLSLSQYLFDELSRQTDMHTPDGRARLAALTKPLLTQVDDPVFKQLLEQELETRIGLRREVVAAPRISQPAKSIARRATVALTMNPMRTVIALLLQFPHLHQALSVHVLHAIHAAAGADLLHELCAHLHDHPGINTGRVLANFQEHPQAALLNQLAAWEHQHRKDDGEADLERLKTTFDDNLRRVVNAVDSATLSSDALSLEQRIAAGTATAEEKAEFARRLRERR